MQYLSALIKKQVNWIRQQPDGRETHEAAHSAQMDALVLTT